MQFLDVRRIFQHALKHICFPYLLKVTQYCDLTCAMLILVFRPLFNCTKKRELQQRLEGYCVIFLSCFCFFFSSILFPCHLPFPISPSFTIPVQDNVPETPPSVFCPLYVCERVCLCTVCVKSHLSPA